MATGDPPSIVDMTNDTLEALELVRKLTGQLAVTEQRLRDLVDGLGVHEFYGEHIDTPLAAARKLLEGEAK